MKIKAMRCRHKVMRFERGAKRGLGRYYQTDCASRATRDLDATGVPTACYAHSRARKEAKRQQSQVAYAAFLAKLARRNKGRDGRE
jgi:hypothetical protein